MSESEENWYDDDIYEYKKQTIIDGDISNLSSFLDKYHFMIRPIIGDIIEKEKMHILDLILSTNNIGNINDYMYKCHCTNNDDIFIASINIFLSLGADLHYKDDYILLGSNINRIIYLINNGCNVNAMNGYVFSEYCRLGKMEIVQFMINCGVTNDNLNKGLGIAFKNS